MPYRDSFCPTDEHRQHDLQKTIYYTYIYIYIYLDPFITSTWEGKLQLCPMTCNEYGELWFPQSTAPARHWNEAIEELRESIHVILSQISSEV